MVARVEEFYVETTKRRELINITSKVEEIVRRSGIKDGICLIFVPHATAALAINEDEPNVRKDYMNLLERLVPEEGNYYHNIIDNNADSHLLSFLLKPFLVLPVKDGELVRGTWQELFLVELDGPRRRRVVVTVLG